jgi:hypothetical protein
MLLPGKITIFCKNKQEVMPCLDFVQQHNDYHSVFTFNAKLFVHGQKISFESAVPRSKFVVEPVKNLNHMKRLLINRVMRTSASWLIPIITPVVVVAGIIAASVMSAVD